MQSLAMIENWPVPTAAAAVVTSDGTLPVSYTHLTLPTICSV